MGKRRKRRVVPEKDAYAHPRTNRYEPLNSHLSLLLPSTCTRSHANARAHTQKRTRDPTDAQGLTHAHKNIRKRACEKAGAQALTGGVGFHVQPEVPDVAGVSVGKVDDFNLFAPAAASNLPRIKRVKIKKVKKERKRKVKRKQAERQMDTDRNKETKKKIKR